MLYNTNYNNIMVFKHVWVVERNNTPHTKLQFFKQTLNPQWTLVQNLGDSCSVPLLFTHPLEKNCSLQLRFPLQSLQNAGRDSLLVQAGSDSLQPSSMHTDRLWGERGWMSQCQGYSTGEYYVHGGVWSGVGCGDNRNGVLVAVTVVLSFNRNVHKIPLFWDGKRQTCPMMEIFQQAGRVGYWNTTKLAAACQDQR